MYDNFTHLADSFQQIFRCLFDYQDLIFLLISQEAFLVSFANNKKNCLAIVNVDQKL